MVLGLVGGDPVGLQVGALKAGGQALVVLQNIDARHGRGRMDATVHTHTAGVLSPKLADDRFQIGPAAEGGGPMGSKQNPLTLK